MALDTRRKREVASSLGRAGRVFAPTGTINTAGERVNFLGFILSPAAPPAGGGGKRAKEYARGGDR